MITDYVVSSKEFIENWDKCFDSLEIHFTLLGKYLMVQILYQNDNLRGLGKILYNKTKDFYIVSDQYPGFAKEANNRLYLRGTDVSKDNEIFIKEFTNIDEAIDFIINVKTTLYDSHRFHQVSFTLSEPIDGVLKKRGIGSSNKLFLCNGIGEHSNA